MDIKIASEILDKINSSSHKKLVSSLIKYAIRYSRLRVDWYLSDNEERFNMDAERTRAHNVFIDSCYILNRNMIASGEDNSWYSMIGKDRKEIGDLACFIHVIIGIKAR